MCVCAWAMGGRPTRRFFRQTNRTPPDRPPTWSACVKCAAMRGSCCTCGGRSCFHPSNQSAICWFRGQMIIRVTVRRRKTGKCEEVAILHVDSQLWKKKKKRERSGVGTSPHGPPRCEQDDERQSQASKQGIHVHSDDKNGHTHTHAHRAASRKEPGGQGKGKGRVDRIRRPFSPFTNLREVRVGGAEPRVQDAEPLGEELPFQEGHEVYGGQEVGPGERPLQGLEVLLI